MFIAMNRFAVVKGSEEAFENVWLSRDSHLGTVPGLWNSAYWPDSFKVKGRDA
jgi:heme-degrading monooxygenase HmoA